MLSKNIDLIILEDTTDRKIDEIITLYSTPIMTNFTENPKGILILIYKGNISVDLDIRESISQENLMNSKVILNFDTNFIISNVKTIRKQITSKYMSNRSNCYKTLRLLHKGIIKFPSNKTDSAYDLLSEIKENLNILEIYNLNFNNNFEDEIKCIFYGICKKFKVDSQIKVLFNTLFKNFNDKILEL